MRDIPRIIIAGTHSGVGKSSLSLALVAALRQRGLKVQTFKVGPDYLDTSHLCRVSGRPCYNLDGWMCGREYVLQLFARASSGADICIIEGVMGLFDGSSASSLDGSTAQIAAWLGAPVLLVLNAHGMARSIAPLIKGFAEFHPDVKIAGVLANMCGSPDHGRWLGEALDACDLPPLVGAVPRGGLPELSSRHLGLVSACEAASSDNLDRQMAEAVEEHIRLDKLIQLAQNTDPMEERMRPACTQKGGLRLGVARDAAFQFYYPDFFDALIERGCELIPFSPVQDQGLPEGLDALYLGGGYPELHADALAANTTMLASVRAFCISNRPVYAECGGLMYLSRGIEQLDGNRHALVGILPTWAKMCEKRKALGYVEATLQHESLFGAAGERLRGHEFHYSELLDSPIGVDGWQAAYALRRNRTGICRPEGYQRGNVLASYAHLHLASHPRAIDNFIAFCTRSA